MDDLGLRKFQRCQSSKKAQLYFDGRKYGPNRVKDMSLGGMFIYGDYDQEVGDECTIIYDQTFEGSLFSFKARGKIVRLSNLGVAIEFVSMHLDSYVLLQTTLLYEAEDPLAISLELPEDSPYEIIIPVWKKSRENDSSKSQEHHTGK